jgi:hypothetical protein
MLLKQQNIFARFNGHPEHRKTYPTRFPTWKSHGNLRWLEQQNISLLRFNAITRRHACFSLCSGVTMRFFALLLEQQNISLLCLNATTRRHACFSLCSGATMQFFDLLLAQQNISARISNHP